MASSQPEHPSEDEDHLEDETVSQYGPDDDDEEVDTRGCFPDSEDRVEEESEVEEDEGDDDEDGDDEDGDDDDNELTIPRPAIDGPFDPTNSPSSLDEPEDVCLERCDRRVGNTTEFLKMKTDETDWDETISAETWVYRGFKRPIGRSSAEKISQIFKEVIPASTRAILGRSTLTNEDIMALPSVDDSLGCPGVYVIFLTQPDDKELQVLDEELIESNTDQQVEVPSGLYTGSSIKSVSGRCVDHRAKFKQIARTKLRNDRVLPNGDIAMYLYCYAKKYGLVPSYRQIAIFPSQLEEIEVPHADTRWLVRLLEQVVIHLLDTYGSSQTRKSRRLYGYTNEMYLESLAQCEIPLNIFHPLNHAMPLKQKCGWTVEETRPRSPGKQTFKPDVFELWEFESHCLEDVPNIHGSFGIKASDLEALEIRCEDCHVLYAKRWCTLGKKSLDRTQDSNLTWDRIICGNCYQKRNMNLARKARGKAKKKGKGKGKGKGKKKGKRKAKTGPSAKLVFENKYHDERKEGNETWQEQKGRKVKQDRPFKETKLLVAYLIRVHGRDFRADKIIDEKVANDSSNDSLGRGLSTNLSSTELSFMDLSIPFLFFFAILVLSLVLFLFKLLFRLPFRLPFLLWRRYRAYS
ncbi:hypothetical protein PEX2_091810 [Penicillium expansum]|uniref:Uncharacterized protein n=1 Tax=Penicillium expansum TaxID=27334 RepID=A0A0A2JVG5_PENEN|nr:hypothetical protein PEX2_091810 [Penicillium expansum]KGO58826.1 hypothetical protein PEX2_091810 [Penicillium expansum]